MIAVNIFLYAYLYWLGFWFIRGTAGLERFFVVGWFARILLTPLQALWPQWTAAVNWIDIFGMATALLAGMSLLLADETNPDRRGGAA